MYAAEKGNVEIAELLINDGANVNLITIDESTALILAAENNHIEIVKLLLQARANIYKEDIEGNTAYSIAKQKVI